MSTRGDILSPRRSTRARRSVTRSMSVESSSTNAGLRGSANGVHDDEDAEEADSVASTSTARRGKSATNSVTKRKSTSSRASSSRKSRGASPVSSPTPTPSVPVLQEEEVVDEEEEVEESDATPEAPLLDSSGRSITPSDTEVEDQVEAVIAADDDDTTTRKASPLSSKRPSSNRSVRRIVLRRRLVSFLSSLGPIIRPLLIISSILLLLLLPSPSPPFAKNTYVDENALQPGQANVGWDWGDVALSDENSRLVEAVKDNGSRARADFLVDRLASFGLQAHTQEYEFELPEPHSRTATQNSELRHGSKTMRGINTYAKWKSGRSDGREAVVIAAGWLSRWDGKDDPFADKDQDEATEASKSQDGSTPSYVKEQRRRTNVRGISIALSLAKYLSHQMHWSKDIIFVFSDGYMEGMQAWSNAYFGVEQSNLKSEAVVGAGATIWNAISVDYPSDSFSSLVLLHQGKDGQLPNMDVLNTVVRIAERLGHITVKLPGSEHDRGEFSAQDDEDGGGWGTAGLWLEKRAGWGWRGVAKYKRAAKNIATQMQVQTLCQPSGLHGLFQRFHVDAITVYAVPARGPYGFWQLGRIIEATMRSFSNLLERLHHSQFFYLLSSPEKFVQLGVYLPVALLLSIALTLTGISKWISEGSKAQERKIGFVDLVRDTSREVDEQLPLQSLSLRSDIALENPKHLDLEMDLAVLVQQNKTLASTREKQHELLKLVTILEEQSRPVASALMLMGMTHFIGLVLFTLVNQAPLDCAADGIETCGALTKTAVASVVSPAVLALSVITVAKVKSARQSEETCTLLPQSAPRRILTLAHVLHCFAMLEAGLVVAVLSVLNFSAATAMAVLLVAPLYFLSLPPTGVQVQVDHQQQWGSLSPSPAAIDDDDKSKPATDASSSLTNPISLPWVAKIPLLSRLGCLSMTLTTLLILLPWNALWLLHVSSMALDETALLARTVDGLLWEWQILGTAFLPILFLVYTPVVLQSVVCGLLASMA